MSTTAPAPAVEYGCDHCNFTSTDPEDFHTLGGDRQTDGGLVAYPATCNGCQEAEYRKWMPRRVRPVGTNAP